MKFYSTNLISLINALSVDSIKITELVLVSRRPRINDSIPYDNYHKFSQDTFSYASKISTYQKIAISRLEYSQYVESSVKPDFLDLSLEQSKFSHKRSIIISGSDAYCALGFINYSDYFLTKIKLEKSWKNAINFNDLNEYYMVGQPNIKSNQQNIYQINPKKIMNNLTYTSQLFQGNIFANYNLDLNTKYLLLIPPQSRISDTKFVKSFFEYANKISLELELKIIIKLHPNEDWVKFTKIVGIQNKYFSNHYSNIPVEFFFSIDNIKKIIAAPSYSLSYVGLKDLEVLVPKNRKIFRKYFLDQLPFLNANNISFKFI